MEKSHIFMKKSHYYLKNLHTYGIIQLEKVRESKKWIAYVNFYPPKIIRET